jgi:hypothetical protein
MMQAALLLRKGIIAAEFVNRDLNDTAQVVGRLQTIRRSQYWALCGWV